MLHKFLILLSLVPMTLVMGCNIYRIPRKRPELLLWDMGRLNAKDFNVLADRVARKMLEDEFFVNMIEKPKVNFTSFRNFTGNTYSRNEDIKQAAVDAIKASGITFVDDDYDSENIYSIRMEANSIHFKDPKTNIEYPSVQMQLRFFKPNGELVGIWSEQLTRVGEDLSWL